MFDATWFEALIKQKAVEVAAQGHDPQRLLDALPEVLDKAIDKREGPLVEELERRMPEMLKEHRQLRLGFERRMRKPWGRGLDLYYATLVACAEAGGEYRATVACQESEKHRFEALSQLHARASLKASEVYTLLRTGYPSGAYALWRTLYELSVIAFVLSDAADAISERYLLHGVVESAEDADEYQRNCAKLGYEPLDAESVRISHEHRDAVLARFGPEFAASYGWARPLFPHGKGASFKKLQERAELAHARPIYRLGSHHAHGGSKGTALNAHTFRGGRILLTGPTNAGLAEVGHSALIALGQVTVALLIYGAKAGLSPNTLIIAKALLVMVDNAGHALAEGEQAVQEAERRFQERLRRGGKAFEHQRDRVG
jgi:hypothetical protein